MTRIATPDKVIACGGLPRSGKTIISGVLGSHGQIAMPQSALNFYYYFSAEAYNSRGGFEENLDFFFESCRKSESWNITRDLVTESGVDRRDLYLILLETFRNAHFPNKKYVGEYTHLSERNFDTLVGWFGLERLRFIQIIRDPYDNYASWVTARKIDRTQRESRSLGAPVHQFCNMWAQSAAMGMARAIRYPKTYRVLYFDQIKVNPRLFVETLCEWLGVPPEVDTMLNMVDQQKKIESAFPIDQGPGVGVGYVKKDDYDRRQHLNEYELAVIRSMVCPDLLGAMGYDVGAAADNGEAPNALGSRPTSARVKLSIRSYLSPLSTRQAAQAYLTGVPEAFRLVFSRALRKLVPRALRRRNADYFRGDQTDA
jgi:hypothetical protein